MADSRILCRRSRSGPSSFRPMPCLSRKLLACACALIWGCVDVPAASDASVSTDARSGAGGAAPDSGNSACTPGGTGAVTADDAIRRSCTVAVVRVTRIDDECSGLGGAHVTLELLEIGRGGPVALVHYGGHGYIPTSEGPDRVGDVFVAGIDSFAAPRPRVDEPAWCLVGLPAVDGVAHSLIAATSAADASTKMRGLLGK
jgi:hypothetical protein